MTETGKGKLYLFAIKDMHSNRIVGCSTDSRMGFHRMCGEDG